MDQLHWATLILEVETTNGSNNTNNSLLQTKHDGNNADYIAYNSNNISDNACILNKGQIETLIKVTDDKLDSYVKKDGSTQMTGHLKLKLKPNVNSTGASRTHPKISRY